MEEIKFRISSQRYPFSSERDVCVVTGLKNALEAYAAKCAECKVVVMKKL